MRTPMFVLLFLLLFAPVGGAIPTDYSVNMTFMRDGNLTPVGMRGDGGTALFIVVTVRYRGADGEPVELSVSGFDGYLSDADTWSRTLSPEGNGTRTLRLKTDYRRQPQTITTTIDAENVVEERDERNNTVQKVHVPETIGIRDVSYPAIGGDGYNTSTAITVRKRGDSRFVGRAVFTVTKPVRLDPRGRPINVNGGEREKILFHNIWKGLEEESPPPGQVEATVELVSNGAVYDRKTIYPPRHTPSEVESLRFVNDGDWRGVMEYLKSRGTAFAQCDGLSDCQVQDNVNRSISAGGVEISSGDTGFCGVAGFKQSINVPSGGRWITFEANVQGGGGDRSPPAGVRVNDEFYSLPTDGGWGRYGINISSVNPGRVRLAIVLDPRATGDCRQAQSCRVPAIGDEIGNLSKFDRCDAAEYARTIQVRDMMISRSLPDDSRILGRRKALDTRQGEKLLGRIIESVVSTIGRILGRHGSDIV